MSETETPFSKPRSEFTPGQKIANRYKIIKPLGQGGMGAVYLVEDLILDSKNVALKILHREHTFDEQHTKRFLREVKLMHKVNHINVARTFDVGADGNIFYFTMEYIQGIGLDILLDTNNFPKEKTISIVSQMCEGLEAIHNLDIVHRDLKPGNIILLDDGTVKITDFGVARPQSSDLTAHNEIVGSPAYVAPEIWEGEAVAPSADIYSLGIIIYELATDLVPFEADNPAALMRQHLQEAPIPPREINSDTPAWFSRLILKLLEKSPKNRFKSAGEVLDYIDQYQSRGYLYRQGEEIKTQEPCVNPEFLYALEDIAEQKSLGNEIQAHHLPTNDRIYNSNLKAKDVLSSSAPSLKMNLKSSFTLIGKQILFSFLTVLCCLIIVVTLGKLSEIYSGEISQNISWLLFSGLPSLLKTSLLLSLPVIFLSSFSRSIFQVLRASFLSFSFILITGSMLTINLMRPVIEQNQNTRLQTLVKTSEKSLEQLSEIILLSPYVSHFKTSLNEKNTAEEGELAVNWKEFTPLSRSPLNAVISTLYFSLLVSVLYKIFYPEKKKSNKAQSKNLINKIAKRRALVLISVFFLAYLLNLLIHSGVSANSNLPKLNILGLSIPETLWSVGLKNWFILILLTFIVTLKISKKKALINL